MPSTLDTWRHAPRFRSHRYQADLRALIDLLLERAGATVQ
jgi:hypothetical protein